MKILTHAQGSKEWRDARLGVITASGASFGEPHGYWVWVRPFTRPQL